jgi:hypothetical protein
LHLRFLSLKGISCFWGITVLIFDLEVFLYQFHRLFIIALVSSSAKKQVTNTGQNQESPDPRSPCIFFSSSSFGRAVATELQAWFVSDIARRCDAKELSVEEC